MMHPVAYTVDVDLVDVDGVVVGRDEPLAQDPGVSPGPVNGVIRTIHYFEKGICSWLMLLTNKINFFPGAKQPTRDYVVRPSVSTAYLYRICLKCVIF